MKLKKVRFDEVRLGAIFFDPASGHKFQKVDNADNRYHEDYNALSNEGTKNFAGFTNVKVHKSSIKGNS